MSKKLPAVAVEDPDYKYDVQPSDAHLQYARALLNVPGQLTVQMLAECFAKVCETKTARRLRLAKNKKHAKSKQAAPAA